MNRSALSAADWSRKADCVSSSVVRLFTRSATSPPTAPRTSTGANCKAAVMPRSTALPVSLNTSQLWASDCIHDPDWEMVWPMNHSR